MKKLRFEKLEPRELLSAAPTLAQPLHLTSRVGDSLFLSVLGADDGGEANLVYQWPNIGTTGKSPTYSDNNDNSAKNVRMDVFTTGTYSLYCQIVDRDHLSVFSNTFTIFVKVGGSQPPAPPANNAPTITRAASATPAAGMSTSLSVQAADDGGEASLTYTWSATTLPAGSAQPTYSVNGTNAAKTTTATFSKAGNYTLAVTVRDAGGLTATSSVSVNISGGGGFLGIADSTLSALVQSLDADGSISRADMMQILRTTETLNGGTLSTSLFTDLNTVVNNASRLNMPDSVRVLASNVVQGNPANINSGRGNLAAGNPASKLDALLGKWFLGSERPAAGWGYLATSGPLFPPAGPSHLDDYQGLLGDCYLISSLGAVADTNPAAIRGAITDNGTDGKSGIHSYTVRFFGGAGTEYVTVDSYLPSVYNVLPYAGFCQPLNSPAGGLWQPLLEKAFAQWSETGHMPQHGAANSYSNLTAGWMTYIFTELTGLPAGYGWMDSQQTMINALATHQAVCIGTSGGGYGLYGSHAYQVLSYSGGLFTLYNPWGTNQPGLLTWGQLQATCQAYAIGYTNAAPAHHARPAMINDLAILLFLEVKP